MSAKQARGAINLSELSRFGRENPERFLLFLGAVRCAAEREGLAVYYECLMPRSARLLSMELSRPIFDDKGAAVDWAERIIMPAISTQSKPRVAPKALPVPEILVERKRA